MSTSRLAAAFAVMAMGASVPAPEADWDAPWTPSGTTHAKRAPRSKATHKQNARKARKGRK